MAYFRCKKCEEKYYSNLQVELHVQTEHDYHGTDHCKFIVREIGIPERVMVEKDE